jgi:hypothetical protein
VRQIKLPTRRSDIEQAEPSHTFPVDLAIASVLDARYSLSHHPAGCVRSRPPAGSWTVAAGRLPDRRRPAAARGEGCAVPRPRSRGVRGDPPGTPQPASAAPASRSSFNRAHCGLLRCSCRLAARDQPNSGPCSGVSCWYRGHSPNSSTLAWRMWAGRTLWVASVSTYLRHFGIRLARIRLHFRGQCCNATKLGPAGEPTLSLLLILIPPGGAL